MRKMWKKNEKLFNEKHHETLELFIDTNNLWILLKLKTQKHTIKELF